MSSAKIIQKKNYSNVSRQGIAPAHIICLANLFNTISKRIT